MFVGGVTTYTLLVIYWKLQETNDSFPRLAASIVLEEHDVQPCTSGNRLRILL
jgi:hypothetical protein